MVILERRHREDIRMKTAHELREMIENNTIDREALLNLLVDLTETVEDLQVRLRRTEFYTRPIGPSIGAIG